ncbi:MAG TPA: hypothetical protein VFQ53_43565 [Kofleriaceae bacterium]|nr:hypothetical protein [Kofleriaceae bacterium]
MANRSYLYTCDELPGGEGFYARGLSEYNWDIPLVHKLMIANESRVVRSAIWDRDIGIVANRAGAFERVIRFFDKVGEGALEDREQFDQALRHAKEFLSTTPDTKYLLLEAGEIYDLQGGDLTAEAQLVCTEAARLGARADRALAGTEAEWLDELRAGWQEQCHPGWWSQVLYFSFKQPA